MNRKYLLLIFKCRKRCYLYQENGQKHLRNKFNHESRRNIHFLKTCTKSRESTNCVKQEHKNNEHLVLSPCVL